MSEPLIILVPVLVLAVVVLFPFLGCVGEDPEAAYERGREEEKKAQETEAAKEKAAEQTKKEAEKYDRVVGKEPDLVSYWRLSEGETGDLTAKDSAPDAPRDGHYKNVGGGGVSRGVPGALALLADPADKAARFDGVQGYVEVPHDILINPPLELTIEAWIRPEDDSPEPRVVVGSYELDAAGSVVRGVVLDVLTVAPATYRLRARVGNGTGFTTVECSLEGGSEHDGWRHVAVTYSVVTKSLKLYVNADNGVPDAEVPAPPPAPQNPVFYVANQSAPLRIGAGQTESPVPAASPALFFKGRIDEVALYRVPLSGSQIRTHFLRGIGITT